MLRFSPSVVMLDTVVPLLAVAALMRMSHSIRIVFVAIVVDGVEILFRHVCMMTMLVTFNKNKKTKKTNLKIALLFGCCRASVM